MKNNEGLIGAVLFVIIIAALSFGCSYWIATSDLPGWLKFWLLK